MEVDCLSESCQLDADLVEMQAGDFFVEHLRQHLVLAGFGPQLDLRQRLVANATT